MAFRTERMKTGKSVKEVADYLGITRQAMNDYELGKAEPRLEFLKKLSELYGCSIERLIGPESKGEEQTNDA